ncbi:hypothetical protein MMC25_004305 [Agyrium rufum]|nr:hypothetical protein [Agyrium rufum]
MAGRPYTPAILRLQVDLSAFPARLPTFTFQTDIFHPLVSPLTTYTHTTSTFGSDGQSAVDQERLPPGGFTLQHGFPSLFTLDTEDPTVSQQPGRTVNVKEILKYILSVFEDEALLDSLPLSSACNPGAWHAWRAHKGYKPATARDSPRRDSRPVSVASSHRRTGSMVRAQAMISKPPTEWNWKGVWADRVSKGIRASISDSVLYSSREGDDLLNFSDMKEQSVASLYAEIRGSAGLPDV